MKWPSLSKIKKEFKCPPGISLDQLSADEVSGLVHNLELWYPDLITGGEGGHLIPKFYLEETFLKNGDCKKDTIPFVLKYDGEIIGLQSIQKDQRACVIAGRLTVIHPKHRGRELIDTGPQLMELIGRETGAGILWVTATLQHRATQKCLERCGFELVGIIPAFDLDQVEKGVSKRVFEAYYVKRLCPESDILYPKKENLLPDTLKLWNYLFDKKL